ncbi:translation elongation factor Ts [candidate division KSB1 bacterium]|nr:translation elongation factor Ts [candidate division KSB1 bacterium]
MEISANIVKELREKTGAGMMDCKKALQENGGDMEKAAEWLRIKGISKAEKRAGRETKEGLVYAYIHPGSRLGVLVEVNCETDFVAKTDGFAEFTKNIAMQIAASNPLYVKREDIPAEVIEKEIEIYREQMADQKKPAQVVDKIAQGKLEKFYQEICLLEQPYIRDTNKSIQNLLTELIATTGENCSIRRFIRYQLGN